MLLRWFGSTFLLPLRFVSFRNPHYLLVLGLTTTPRTFHSTAAATVCLLWQLPAPIYACPRMPAPHYPQFNTARCPALRLPGARLYHFRWTRYRTIPLPAVRAGQDTARRHTYAGVPRTRHYRTYAFTGRCCVVAVRCGLALLNGCRQRAFALQQRIRYRDICTRRALPAFKHTRCYLAHIFVRSRYWQNMYATANVVGGRLRTAAVPFVRGFCHSTLMDVFCTLHTPHGFTPGR